MCDVLVAGINSDEEVRAVKGPTIMTMEERAEYLRHCKFVDEVQPSTPYTPTPELLK
jgi:choline-phosphate cytidylyltransferase